jgi:DNA-binding SARP family transcriptional activator
MAATLSIRLFGGLDLRLDDAQVPALASARGESLLAYLLLNRGAPQPRQHVAFCLWPDSTEQQARTNLRHVLHDLRRALPDADAFLDVQPRTVQWRPRAPVWLDVAAFEAACTRIERAASKGAGSEDADDEIAALCEAIDLYRGDLLEACYDEWITTYRAQFRHRYLALLEQLAARLDARGRHADAIPYVERLLRHEPLREDAYRLLMRLHDARGDRARALQTFHACTATLARELGVAPSEATRQAHEELLRGDAGRGPTGVDASERQDRPGIPPLVGRANEWARLAALWRDVETGKPGFLLVTGEAGAGKTRLLEELRTWCALRGAIVADARSYSAEGGLAYGPLVTWLRAPALDPRVLRADRQRLSDLSRLLPELLSRAPGVPHPSPLPASDHRHRLFDAAAGVLLSLGAAALLVVDDIQWCDQETLRFLHYLLRSARGTPLLVAATARAEDADRHQPLIELIAGLRALGLTTELELERLTREATADLAATLASRALDDEDAAALFRETEGNPLFVVEAVRAGWPRDGHGSPALTPRVHTVIASRLAQLSDAAHDLVGIAATLGRDFSVDLLACAADTSGDALARALDELWRTRIVREHGGGVYDFSHDKIREVAYLALSPPSRRQAHLRAAHALKRVGSHDPDAVSAQIAAHYDRAGMAEEAITWYEAAAEAAERLHASREAVRLLSRAAELLRSLPPSVHQHARELAILTATLTPLASVEGFTSRRLDEMQRSAVELARALAVDAPPQVLRSLAISSLSRDDFDAARRFGEQLQARGQTDGDDALLVESEYVLGIAAFWKGELEIARRHFEAAVTRFRPDRRRAHLLRYWLDPQVVCLSRLANTLWFLGDAPAACRARDEALALADEIGHEHTRRTALVFGALLAVDMEDTDQLRRHVAALAAGQTEHDARPTRASTEAFGALVRVLDGETQAGIASIRAALDDLREGGYAPGHRAMFARLLIAAYDAAGDVRGRLAAADEMLAMRGAAALWEAEAHRVRADCLAELGGSAHKIRLVLESALAVARRQGARMLEQRALNTLARHAARFETRSISAAAP